MTVINLEESLIETDDRASVPLDTLKIPSGKKRRVKSPTPARALSTTPTRRSRSKTPFNLYLSRHSADPNEPTKWRSITPFINRKDKEQTPFELGKDLKSQLISHKMVFDKASVMDISESDFEPVRYITSDVSVIDRASVMDVSNIEIIYLVEEYDEEEIIEEERDGEEKEELSKKKKGKKGRKSKSMDKEDSPSETGEYKKKETKTKKKSEKKKKEERDESRSPSPPPLPKLTLKLEFGGGSKMNKKMFEQKPVADAKPPAKKLIKSAVSSNEQLREDISRETSQRRSENQDIEENLETSYNTEEELDADEIIENIGSEFKEKEGKIIEMTDNEATMDSNEINIESKSKTITTEQTENKSSVDEQIINIEIVKKEKPRKKIIEVKDPSPTKEQIVLWDQIYNDEGQRFMEKIKKFTLQKRNDPKNPCFVNHLPNSTSLEGQKLRLVCSINGVDLTIKWYKNDEEIKSGDQYKIHSDKNNILSLEILHCKPSDTGNYSCVLSTKQKKVKSSCFVCIYDLSRFQDEPCPPYIDCIEDSYHFLSDELMIQCKVHGCPRPTLTWSRENYEIKEEHSLIEEAHGIHRMIIKKPCPYDTGIYVLKAVNSRGQYERKHCVEFFINTEKIIY